MRLPTFAWVMLIASIVAATEPSARADEREDFFEAKIRPVLVSTCFGCHGGGKTSGALRIDSREMLLTGGDSGAAIVPGKPDESLLITAIRRAGDVTAMPPDQEKALRPDQVADFVAWVKGGAVWPAKSKKFEAATHWSFQPIRDPAAPRVKDHAWGKTSIDAFIRARQEAAGVEPASTADKLTLIRRATFDLTGLPPTSEEVEAFVRDNSPRAFEAVVERLLKSPAYGERWGRHWLDVVRYADTAGETADYPAPLAWRYRNYVIDSFNADKPYDEFLREQIAGDTLPGTGERYAEQVTATGFLAISRRFGFDSENYHHLTIQDTIDTLGQAALGLSLGCARCHDHKFDAISTQDYYGLYGIFDSSRYPFPGSEQKQKVRSMAPLLPPSQSQAKWREHESRIAELAERLAKLKQPTPAGMLASLNEIDGDFELQAPAAGGSNGVLVPPWLYDGPIAVTTAAQSPFKNRYRSGRVGASVAAEAGAYRIQQALYPRRTSETGSVLHVNLDFRIGDSPGTAHRFLLGAIHGKPAVEVLLSSDALSLRVGDKVETVAAVKPNQWQNLQLSLDLKAKTFTGRVGSPGAVVEFAGKPFLPDWTGAIDAVTFTAQYSPDAKAPAIEFDNLVVQDAPLAPVSTEPPPDPDAANLPDLAAVTEQLRQLTGIDGEFELQTKDSAPVAPWNPGPNSVAKLSTTSQSPFYNIYGPGELGMSLPNRGEYDGFGLTIPSVKPDGEGRLFASFDFRCASDTAGGAGSWRYYLGHGPGPSAAVELFLNGQQFFRRSAGAIDAVSPLAVGEWYQVQLTLNLKAKTYTGVLASRAGKTEFQGELASGWDGQIDYSFIDSYGHLGGVRPALDADNFALADKPLPPLDAAPVSSAEGSRGQRLAKIAQLRKQLAEAQTSAETLKQELNSLLVDGPFAMAYGMSEGTPHNVRLQNRGEPDQLGDEVPRGFIKALGGGPLPAETVGSGRRELAQWLTRAENPLTARVMVNRIWQYHFGRGLVKTPNDFGVRGLPPTHPELLDHLATQFIRNGWSIKSLHRLILLSATYQQASQRNVATGESDQADLYTSFRRRRLSAEEIRDSILMVSGELDATPGREHPFPAPTSWGFSQHGPFSAVYDHNKRSVYLMTQRIKRHPFLALFDGADPNTTTADRLGTTVPTQALFFLNDPFVHAKADKWAERLIAASPDERQRIDSAWPRALGRTPTETELAEAAEFLAAYRTELATAKSDNIEARSLAAYLRTLLGSNEFLHVD